MTHVGLGYIMSMTVTMDDALKADFADVCAEIGMSSSTAINVFVRKVVRDRRIPFELSAAPDTPKDHVDAAYEHALSIALVEGYLDAEAGRTHSLEELRAARAQEAAHA